MFANIKLDEAGRPYHGTDKSLFVEFFMVRELQMQTIINPEDPTRAGEVVALTDENGEFVTKEIPYIRITTPGSKNTRVERPVKMQGDHSMPSDIERFAYQWERFKKGEDQKQKGHLLSAVGLGEKEVRCFSEHGVFTVEQLLDVPDGLLPNITLGARSIREKARIWLNNQVNDEKQNADHTAELAAQSAKIADLEAKIHALLEAQNAPSAEVVKKRGRPSSSQEVDNPVS